MVQTIVEAPDPAPSSFLQPLYELTEGNPFFVEEVVKSLLGTGDIHSEPQGASWQLQALTQVNIPRTVRYFVEQRISLLSAPARQVLSLAAVVGRRFNFALLRRLAGLDEADLLAHTKELVRAQLVVEVSPDLFAFRHALTREAVYADLLGRERRALHRLCLQVLEEEPGTSSGSRSAELAYHAYQAGEWGRVITYGEEAGARALALYSPVAAVEQISKAVDAADRLSLSPPRNLLRIRAQANEMLGDFDAAFNDYEQSLVSARNTQDKEGEWQALLDLGWLWTGRDYQRSGLFFQEALSLARTLPDPATLAHTLNRVGNWIGHTNPLTSRQHHSEARALFRAQGDREGEAATLEMLGVSSFMSGDILAGVGYYEQAVRLFRELNNRQGLASSLMTLATRGASYLSLPTVSPYVEATSCLHEAEEALSITRAIDWRAGEAAALAYLAHIEGPQGLFASAVSHGEAGLALARELGHRQWMISALLALGGTAYDMLHFGVAQERFAEALGIAQEISSDFMVALSAGWLALTSAAQRDLEAAKTYLRLAAPSPLTAFGSIAVRYGWFARARLALVNGDAATAFSIVEQLIETAPHTEYWGEGASPHLWHLRGEAFSALGRPREAETSFVAAERVAQLQGLRPLQQRIVASLGYLYRGQRRRKEADLIFERARGLAGDLASGLPEGPERTAFESRIFAVLPRERALTPRRSSNLAFGGLTDRERAIALRITRGGSNRAIAAELVLSERTVEKHIGNILSKLGLQSRTQIATWAVEAGLVRQLDA